MENPYCFVEIVARKHRLKTLTKIYSKAENSHGNIISPNAKMLKKPTLAPNVDMIDELDTTSMRIKGKGRIQENKVFATHRKGQIKFPEVFFHT